MSSVAQLIKRQLIPVLAGVGLDCAYEKINKDNVIKVDVVDCVCPPISRRTVNFSRVIPVLNWATFTLQ